MARAFVLGNGISRKIVSPLTLRPFGLIYGCNALYREFAPDVLVATDKPIATHIQESGYPKEHKFYTRKPIPGSGAHQVPAPYYAFSSGPIAIGIAAREQNKRIYLLGFDMGPTLSDEFNNIYADTEFYKKSGAAPTFTGNWVKQVRQVIADFPHTQFIRVHGETTAKIPEFDNLRNLTNLDINQFLDRINNETEL
jgi:hypothetical protein